MKSRLLVGYLQHHWHPTIFLNRYRKGWDDEHYFHGLLMPTSQGTLESHVEGRGSVCIRPFNLVDGHWQPF